jgi:hypothetical protein
MEIRLNGSLGNEFPKAVRRAMSVAGHRPAVAGNRLRGAASSVRSRPRRSGPPEQSGEKRNHHEGEKNEEQYFRDSDRGAYHAPEPKRAGYDRHDKKYERPVKHVSLLRMLLQKNVVPCTLFHHFLKKTIPENRSDSDWTAAPKPAFAGGTRRKARSLDAGEQFRGSDAGAACPDLMQRLSLAGRRTAPG